MERGGPGSFIRANSRSKRTEGRKCLVNPEIVRGIPSRDFMCLGRVVANQDRDGKKATALGIGSLVTSARAL